MSGKRWLRCETAERDLRGSARRADTIDIDATTYSQTSTVSTARTPTSDLHRRWRDSAARTE
ncbi:hypothetical protein [Corynebacterium sp. NML140438]|uniref:hypothetical protein n=1 Tax=Corynebacterium sp. NML140438 TaxID=1906334 RepID=UPI00116095A8|nr:hypothetical protein [Corynebacterium sp. NML140438]